MFCYKCGNKLEDFENFCAKCGASQKQSVKIETPAAESRSDVPEASQAMPETPMAKPESPQVVPETVAQAKPVTHQLGENQISRTLLALMTLLLGGFGVHDFIVGNNRRGVFKILLSILSIISTWWFVCFAALCLQDLKNICDGTYKTNGKEIVGEKNAAKILFCIGIAISILGYIGNFIWTIRISPISTILSLPLTIVLIVFIAKGDDLYSWFVLPRALHEKKNLCVLIVFGLIVLADTIFVSVSYDYYVNRVYLECRGGGYYDGDRDSDCGGFWKWYLS